MRIALHVLPASAIDLSDALRKVRERRRLRSDAARQWSTRHWWIAISRNLRNSRFRKSSVQLLRTQRA